MSSNDLSPRESGGTIRFRLTGEQLKRVAELQEEFGMTRKEVVEILFQELADGIRIKGDLSVREVVLKGRDEH